MRFSVLISTAALLAMSCLPASATDPNVAKCAAIKDSGARLQCFDALTGGPGAPTDQESLGVGDWQTQSRQSKVDDSTDVTIWHAAQDPIKDRFGRDKDPQVTVACIQGHTNLYFTVGDMFLADSGGFGDVVVRLDKAKARTFAMNESTDHSALGLWNGSGVKLIKQMATASRAVVVITPFNESQVTFEVDLAGMAGALQPLRKSCGW